MIYGVYNFLVSTSNFWHTHTSEGRLKIKMSPYQYRDPHVKDKTVSLASYIYHENPHTWENGLYI